MNLIEAVEGVQSTPVPAAPTLPPARPPLPEWPPQDRLDSWEKVRNFPLFQGKTQAQARTIANLLFRFQLIAQRLERKPTLAEFSRLASIPRDRVYECLESFGDLVRAAGYRGELRTRDPQRARVEMLSDYAAAVTRLGRKPSRAEYLANGKFSVEAIERYVAPWPKIGEVFIAFAARDPRLAEAACIVGATPTALPPLPGHSPNPDLPVCGNPLDFRTMRHEPVNEQGVVLLFGMMAEELGFLIESVQQGYPDCEAKRQLPDGRWQRVRIEFEFLSSRFNHDKAGCDLVVCWRHDWEECPVDVIELKDEIRKRRRS